MKKLSQAIVVASALTAGLVGTQAAHAEISASADIASAYLFRGMNLSQGEAVVSGSLDYANKSGIYAGVWGSSGDTKSGTEYDLYVGFSKEFGDVSVDVGYVSFIYPNSADDDIDDFGEYYLGLGFQNFSLGAAANTDTDKNGEYVYYTLGYEMDAVAATVGFFTDGDEDADGSYTHVDLSYAYNDSLSFTVSQIVDHEDDDRSGDSTNFVVGYSLPIE